MKGNSGHIAAVYEDDVSADPDHLSKVDYTISDSTWHSAKVTYNGSGTITCTRCGGSGEE